MSTQELRFDDRVAVVTGAGRGLGREHALFLASRGAKVVVNNRSAAAADATTAEIIDAGGEAIANASDVSTKEGAVAPIDAAINEYGRIDILVNNAGIYEYGDFATYPDETFYMTIASHVYGAWFATQAAWPHMIERKYGRVVNIGSRVMIGQEFNVAYGTAKGALLGLANCLAVEGRPYGIQINTLSVGGYTEGIASHVPDPALKQWIAELLPAWAVARPLAWLVHEDCHESGKFFSAWGRGFSRLFLAEADGYVSSTWEEHTPENVRGGMAKVYDESGYIVAKDQVESGAYVARRLGGRTVEEIRAADLEAE
jgi:NAD(P)-dependent dehydrogenase (short-subunit alcohol dehydrogenase family)